MALALSEIVKDIELWQSKIERAKIERAKLEGKLSSLIKTLKDQFDIDDLKEAEKRLKEVGKELDQLSEQVQKQYDEIRREYDI